MLYRLQPHALQEAAYSGADLLLVSDGELPDPPLDEATHARLRRLQAASGLRVCGLLVGEPRLTPLDAMCDDVSGCLARFDPLALMREATAARATGAAEATALGRPAAAVASAARVRPRGAVPHMSAMSDGAVGGTAALAQVLETRAAEEVAARLRAADATASAAETAAFAAFEAVAIKQEAMETGQAKEAGHAEGEVAGGGGVAAALRAATAALECGLVERDGEARLLLLALVGGEHLLLLGPPGTAKSELCRRLSRLSGLSYFERTLTRFSTPEVHMHMHVRVRAHAHVHRTCMGATCALHMHCMRTACAPHVHCMHAGALRTAFTRSARA